MEGPLPILRDLACCLICLTWAVPGALANPPLPVKQTWVLRSGESHKEWNITSQEAPLWTWFPDLHVNLERVFGELYNLDAEPSRMHSAKTRAPSGPPRLSARQRMRANGFLACPGYKTGAWRQMCGGAGDLYCAAWQCAVASDGEWRRQVAPELIDMRFVYPYNGWPVRESMNLVRVSFTEQGKKDRRWLNGLTWGLVPYKTPRKGVLLQVILRVEPASGLVPVGRNEVIQQVTRPRPLPGAPTPAVASRNLSDETPVTATVLTQPGGLPGLKPDPLWGMVGAVYSALNSTAPNLTEACWLCYEVNPPFYEAVGINVSVSVNTTVPSGWKARPVGLTLKQVSGQGSCVGTVPDIGKRLCATTCERPDWSEGDWITPGGGGWWACSHTGLTPHLSAAVFNASLEFCVTVALVPRILYHPKETVFHYWERETPWTPTSPLHRNRREPITTLSVATLLSQGFAGTGTEAASLATQSKGFTSLRAAVDEDLDCRGQFISRPAKPVASQSEVVLQNRRGRQGGLCAALGEECCFYADHTGLVRDSMAKLRENLAKRKKELEAHRPFEPWLAILLALAGLFVILFLLFTVGRWILNRLVGFIRERVGTVQLVVIQQPYQAPVP